MKPDRTHILVVLCALAMTAGVGLAETTAPFTAWPKAGLVAREFITLEGRTQGEGTLWLQTPEDMDDRGLDEPVFRERLKPEGVRFEDLGRVVINKPRREIIAPAAHAVDCYPLGQGGSASPPPPNWKGDFGRRPDWDPAVEVEPGVMAPYVEHGEFFWTSTAQDDGRREALFRHVFRIAEGGRIGRATLVIAGRAEVVEASLNGAPIHLGGRREFGLAGFEVTPLLREGGNTLAIWARSPGGAGPRKPSLTFSIEIERAEEAPRGPFTREVERQGALLLLRGGDRIQGDLSSSIRGEWIELRTDYGTCRAGWESVEALLFPRGFEPDAGEPRRGMLARIERNRRKPAVIGGPDKATGLPLHIEHAENTGLVLLTDGRTLVAEPVAIEGASLRLAGNLDAAQQNVPVSELLAVYPRMDSGGRIEKPSPEALPLFVAATTRRGERISGILRQAARSGVIIEARGEGFLKIPARDLLQLDFTQHRLARELIRQGGAPPPGIGFLGRPEGLNRQADEKAALLARELQSAAFLAGVRCEPVGQESLTDAEALRRDFSAIALLDPLGEYADTLRGDGDARNALAGFVNAGGTLLLYSRGGALRSPLKNEGGGFVKMEGEAGLAGALGLHLTGPGGEQRPGLSPFERPARECGGLTAALTPGGDARFRVLPSRFTVGGTCGAIFYPLTAAEGAEGGRVLYMLESPVTGPLGPAMTVFPRGQGRVIVIDHLLWRATADGQGFTESVLPLLLLWMDEPV